MSYSRIPRMPGVNKLRIVAVVVTVIIIIIILVESVVTVQAGYRGVVSIPGGSRRSGIRRRAAFYHSLRRTGGANGGTNSEIPS